MGRFLRKFKKKQGRKGIVKSGLMMHLDGRDFKNNPATNLWYDRVRSETVGYSNLVTNGNNFALANATGSTLGDTTTFTAIGQYGRVEGRGGTFVAGNKYYVSAKIKSTSNYVKLIISRNAGYDQIISGHSGSGLFEKLSGVATLNSPIVSANAGVMDFRASAWDAIQIKEFMCIDLTAIFGAGNEPSVAECDLIFPFTATQSTTHRSSDYNPENMVKYNPVTWGEFVKSGTVGDATGLELTTSASASVYGQVATNLKPSTKYGFLANIISNTLVGYLWNGGDIVDGFGMVAPSYVGNKKLSFTTYASITNNKFTMVVNPETAGNKIKLKDIRVFELPTGSQIESDFTNLTADQLAIKYPVQRAALPYNFGYIAPYASIMSGFVGKVAGSVVANPNKFKGGVLDTILNVPSSVNWVENDNNAYGLINTLNSLCAVSTRSANGQIPQLLFSFNLIEIFERRHGTIPSTDQTTAGKVAWLRANLNTIAVSWYGYGSCPAGNKAYLTMARADNVVWGGATSHTASSPTVLTGNFNMWWTMANCIDVNGFVHFLAYTDASDGVTPSTIYTDYIKLDLTFKAASGSDNQGGVVFDGVDDYETVLNSASIDLNSDFTLEMKIKGNSSKTGTMEVLLVKAEATGTNIGYGLLLRSSAPHIKFWVYDVGLKTTTIGQEIRDNNVHIIQAKKEGVFLKLYVDGVLISSDNVSVIGSFSNMINLRIGSEPASNQYFNGTIYYTRIYNRALTDQEIKQNYLATR